MVAEERVAAPLVVSVVIWARPAADGLVIQGQREHDATSMGPAVGQGDGAGPRRRATSTLGIGDGATWHGPRVVVVMVLMSVALG